MHSQINSVLNINCSILDTQKKVTTTPLLDFLKQRKQEKQRMREEKREVRRRRRLKDEPTISQVIKRLHIFISHNLINDI